MTLLKVPESGEFKRASMTEAAESYKLETFGRVVGITRQALRTGATTVSYEGKSVSYATAAELRAAIRELEQEIAGVTLPKGFVVRANKNW